MHSNLNDGCAQSRVEIRREKKEKNHSHFEARQATAGPNFTANYNTTDLLPSCIRSNIAFYPGTKDPESISLPFGLLHQQHQLQQQTISLFLPSFFFLLSFLLSLPQPEIPLILNLHNLSSTKIHFGTIVIGVPMMSNKEE
jgi:hypothetical protein